MKKVIVIAIAMAFAGGVQAASVSWGTGTTNGHGDSVFSFIGNSSITTNAKAEVSKPGEASKTVSSSRLDIRELYNGSTHSTITGDDIFAKAGNSIMGTRNMTTTFETNVDNAGALAPYDSEFPNAGANNGYRGYTFRGDSVTHSSTADGKEKVVTYDNWVKKEWFDKHENNSTTTHTNYAE